MSAAAEALSESHWIARHLLSSLPAAARLALRVAYGDLRARVIRPLRDARVVRGDEHEQRALEDAARWLRALASDDDALLSSLRVAETFLLDLLRSRDALTPAEASIVEHALGILARFDAAARPLTAAIRAALEDPARAPPAVVEVGHEVARCKLTLLAVIECLGEEGLDAGLRRFWLERLLTDAVALDGAMARSPTWASELRAELERAEIREALGRGDVSQVKRRIDDPRGHLSEGDRARYRRLLSFSARANGPSSPQPSEPPAVPRLRSSPEAVWVAIQGGAELTRAHDLKETLDRARAMGVTDPLLVWLPAKDAAHAAP
jgi:hypothetical protein